MNNRTDIDIVLTMVDRQILQSYCDMLDGLSQYLGDGYEIVLHSLEDCNHSAIKVINGFHTGREEGAPITDLALSMLEKIENQNSEGKGITYFVKNKSGEPLRSTTILVRGENHRIIGLLCINFYLNTPIGKFVKDLLFDERPLPSRQEAEPAIPVQEAKSSSNSVELVEHLVVQIRDEVMMDSSILLSNKNKEIIHRLEKRGVFNFKDSVIKTAQLLKISKNTVYLHLRHTRQDADSE